MSNQIRDDGQMWKYFAPMLHMDDDDLDPYAYRLLGHYRRVCGVNGGTCTESTRTTAENTKMSIGKVSSARRELARLGRINIEETKKTLHITLNDCWRENILRYSACSSGEQVNSDSCSSGETKNNKSKEEQQKTLAPPENGAVSGDDMTVISEQGVTLKSEVLDFYVPTPEKPRKAKPWYDVIVETMNVHGARNRYVEGVLLANGKGAYAQYNLADPLTDPEQVRVFWRWFQSKCEGCDLIGAPTVQDWVMKWQAAGCPDANKKSSDAFTTGMRLING